MNKNHINIMTVTQCTALQITETESHMDISQDDFA